ncbi:MAG TPA: hypothetical protein DDZ51_23940 [Planctomycetaceae bacterium]|nr:hypothetical protein [Planctomycetaceae bacterium]
MADSNLVYVAIVPLVFLLIGIVPSRIADDQVSRTRQIAIIASFLGLFLSVVAMAYLFFFGFRSGIWFLTFDIGSVPLGIYFDSLSSMMLVLIQFIGLVIVSYSLRYLDGEATQGRFLRWICFTIGSVSLMVVSHHLAMFAVAWMMTSLGLHKLLVHYGDRRRAVVAARKKLLISRLGDIFLLFAILITYQCFGTLTFAEIFSITESIRQSSFDQPMAAWIGPLLVLGAMTKSAQFPFHSWLPDTMEAPTPVSALMHAGIINAGGFLIIRLSPLVSLSSVSLQFLAVVGAITALFGAAVMLTQTSVKKCLAYSTIAQMGFMMLQCGLGAFSAALLHIVGHSLYKAYSFLNAGSVIDNAGRLQTDIEPVKYGDIGLIQLGFQQVLAIVIATTSLLIPIYLIDLDWSSKPGAAILGLVLMFAIASANLKAMRSNRLKPLLATVAGSIVTSFAYCGGFLVMEAVLATTRSSVSLQLIPWQTPLVIILAVVFALLFVLHSGIDRWRQTRLMQRLYVATLNGFYFDVTAQRLSERVWPKKAIGGSAE